MAGEESSLKRLRLAQKLTQKEVADFLGVKQGHYSRIEALKVGLTKEHLDKLVSLYGVEEGELFDQPLYNTEMRMYKHTLELREHQIREHSAKGLLVWILQHLVLQARIELRLLERRPLNIEEAELAFERVKLLYGATLDNEFLKVSNLIPSWYESVYVAATTLKYSPPNPRDFNEEEVMREVIATSHLNKLSHLLTIISSDNQPLTTP